MRIAINARPLIKDKLEGIGWFTYETLRRICERHQEHRFFFIFDRPFSEQFIFGNNITPIVAGLPTKHPVLFYLWFEKTIPKILKKIRADIFFSPDGFISLSTDVPTVSVVHDINFAHRPNDLPFLISRYYNYFFPKFAMKSKRIATVSEYSANDISKTFKVERSKIDVVFNGVNDIFAPLSAEDKYYIRQQYSAGCEYFVFIGALHPRKNVEGLLKGFDLFKSRYNSDIKLVIVGDKMFKTRSIDIIFKRLEYKDDVIFTGRLLASELKRVMGGAIALTFVSFFEGFGIPILESMKCGVPVITSTTTSMPEVAGDAAIYVNPNSVSSIAEGMYKVVTDVDLRNLLVAKGKLQSNMFSWDKTSEKLWNCIVKAHNG